MPAGRKFDDRIAEYVASLGEVEKANRKRLQRVFARMIDQALHGSKNIKNAAGKGPVVRVHGGLEVKVPVPDAFGKGGLEDKVMILLLERFKTSGLAAQPGPYAPDASERIRDADATLEKYKTNAGAFKGGFGKRNEKEEPQEPQEQKYNPEMHEKLLKDPACREVWESYQAGSPCRRIGSMGILLPLTILEGMRHCLWLKRTGLPRLLFPKAIRNTINT